jgi:hypothetical protein
MRTHMRELYESNSETGNVDEALLADVCAERIAIGDITPSQNERLPRGYVTIVKEARRLRALGMPSAPNDALRSIAASRGVAAPESMSEAPRRREPEERRIEGYRPQPTDAIRDATASSAEVRFEREWAESSAVRAEFLEKKHYIAFRRAEERGAVKVTKPKVVVGHPSMRNEAP